MGNRRPCQADMSSHCSSTASGPEDFNEDVSFIFHIPTMPCQIPLDKPVGGFIVGS